MKATLALSKTLRAILEEDGSLRLEDSAPGATVWGTATLDPQETAFLAVLLGGQVDVLRRLRQALIDIRENSDDSTARQAARQALREVA